MHIWSQLSLLKRKISGLTKSPRSVHVCTLDVHSYNGDYNIMRNNGRTSNDDAAKTPNTENHTLIYPLVVQLSDLRGEGGL